MNLVIFECELNHPMVQFVLLGISYKCIIVFLLYVRLRRLEVGNFEYLKQIFFVIVKYSSGCNEISVIKVYRACLFDTSAISISAFIGSAL